MNVVITGSTKGIGLGMAREFVRRGHNVVVSSRQEPAVQAAIATLTGTGPGQVAGLAVDVARMADVQRLWDAAVARFGSVDLWINNAGVTNRRAKFTELPDDQVSRIMATNVTGLMNSCKVALTGMLAQGRGTLFNMEGFGSDGLVQPGMSVYGTSKAALRYFTRSLVKDYRDTPLVIGLMSPGIVVTDLLTRDMYTAGTPEFEQRRRFLNVLADRVETVAPYLVDGALAARRSGTTVRWMGPMQALGRVVKCLFVRRDPFAGVDATT